MSRILIVEDELKIAQLEADYLRNAGFLTHCIHNGLDVVPWLKKHVADLVVLDLMLPGVDGLTICRSIRDFSQVPIIMITARIEEIDRLLGLELGADDYLCKPFSPREMVARIQAVLRRTQANTHFSTTQQVAISIDSRCMRVTINKQALELTAVEFQLLQVLYAQPGHIFTRSALMDLMYPDDRVVSDRTIDSHIKKLRKKISDVLPDQEIIHSVYGAGYRYEVLDLGY